MEIEHEVKVIPIDADHQRRVDEFVAQGWQLIPGMVPIGVYPVVRVKQPALEPQFGAIGEFGIDDTKVGVHRVGTPPDQIEWPGNFDPETETKQ